jgi:uncharacterized OB-fold protein
MFRISMNGQERNDAGATDHIRLFRRAEERVSPDRRRVDRGGRRETDRLRVPVEPRCDGCGSPAELEWLSGTKNFDEYRCRQCGAYTFLARQQERR